MLFRGIRSDLGEILNYNLYPCRNVKVKHSLYGSSCHYYMRDIRIIENLYYSQKAVIKQRNKTTEKMKIEREIR